MYSVFIAGACSRRHSDLPAVSAIVSTASGRTSRAHVESLTFRNTLL
jgi:hypothetical protein